MKHYILVKYNDAVTEKEALLEEIRELFQKTTQIEGIHQVNVYPCCIDRPNRYDVMIEITMEKEALPAYDDCQWHHIWKRDYAKYLEKKTIFDRED